MLFLKCFDPLAVCRLHVHHSLFPHVPFFFLKKKPRDMSDNEHSSQTFIWGFRLLHSMMISIRRLHARIPLFEQNVA